MARCGEASTAPADLLGRGDARCCVILSSIGEPGRKPRDGDAVGRDTGASQSACIGPLMKEPSDAIEPTAVRPMERRRDSRKPAPRLDEETPALAPVLAGSIGMPRSGFASDVAEPVPPRGKMSAAASRPSALSSDVRLGRRRGSEHARLRVPLRWCSCALRDGSRPSAISPLAIPRRPSS